MLHNLGKTRSSLKADHLLQTPDTFIRTPLPGVNSVEFIVHIAPQLGAGFIQMTAEFAAGGVLPAAPEAVERFLYVLEGQLTLTAEDTKYSLNSCCYAFIPHGTDHDLKAISAARVVILEKFYQGLNSPEPPKLIVGNEFDIPSEPLGGDDDLQVRHLMPDGPTWDFAVNTMTYQPGVALSQVEIHVMEHGLLMLEGGGIYRLGDHWYPVTAGDFIWMAPYCPQWFGALGKTPAKYLIYKDWYRHPLGG